MIIKDNENISDHCLKFEAGASEKDITPPLGTIINGDFVTHYANHIHDPLFVKAVVFRQGEFYVAIVVVDICVMSKSYVDSIKDRICLATNIAPQQVLISSTHTHAAGAVEAVYLCGLDLIYKEKLPDTIVAAVVEAKSRLQPAKIAYGQVLIPEHVRSRRYHMHPDCKPLNPVTHSLDKVRTNPFGMENFIERPATVTDPELSYLGVKSLDDKWITVIANYSLHYVGDWPNGTISADYFGCFAKALKDILHADDSFVGIMSNGTSGDINIWDFSGKAVYPKEDFKKSEYIGSDIAHRLKASIDLLDNNSWELPINLSVLYEEIPIALRKPDKDSLQMAKNILQNCDLENIQLDIIGMQCIYAREQLMLNELPDYLQFPLQVIRIGPGVIGGLGAEVFAKTGRWLKSQAGIKNYFTIGLANGNQGYLPAKEDFVLGGYETWRSRTSKMKEDAEDKIKQRHLELISQILAI